MESHLGQYETVKYDRMRTSLIHYFKSIPDCIREGEFTLASGIQSKYYIDGKKLSLNGAALVSASMCLQHLLKKLGSVTVIGGMELGAVPITVGCLVMFQHPGVGEHAPINGFIVRKEAKGHGTKTRIEGHVAKEDLAVVVEDTTTTGGSLLQAIEVLREERGCEIVGALSIVDRQHGAKELLAKNGYRFHSILTASDLGIVDK